jgi:hypothetical protein
MTYRIAFPLLALLVAGGCSTTDATGPMSLAKSPGTIAAVEGAENSPRSGALHVTKECSQYTAQAGSFCTITSSNLKQIAVESRVVYAKALTSTTLDSDISIYPADGGNNVAFGHVVLDFVTSTGVVTLSGGTGKFKGISARADVTHLSGPNWAWDGTYSFSNKGDDED